MSWQDRRPTYRSGRNREPQTSRSSRTTRSTRGSSYDESPRVTSRGELRPAAGPGPSQGPTFIMVLLFFALAVVCIRLIDLQVFEAGDLVSKMEASRSGTVAITAKRGTIYDRNGNVLATTVDCKTVVCNPQEISDVDKTARLLAQDLGGRASDFTKALSGDSQYAYIKKKVDTDQADKLKQDLNDAELTGIYFESDTKRVYPYGNVGGQILGFVGDDGHGLSGIELSYDDVLSGTDGQMYVERGADGTPVAGGAYEVEDATDGQDVVLSIDVNIQQVVEEQIQEGVKEYESDSGSALVMNPQTGEVLAACSTPLLDPTDQSTVTDEAMQLKLVSSSYEPGSIMKPIVMAIGIDAGTITPASTFTVPAKVQVGDDLVGDDDERDYTMDMDCTEILRRSSNTGMILVGRTLTAEQFADGMTKFGIGSTTGIDFPGEQTGIVASLDDYTSTTQGTMSFGQGMAVPMIQVIRAIAAIANDGVMTTPHFLVSKNGEAVDWSEGETRVISSETSDEVVDMMRTVVNEGTGTAAQVEGYDVAGKTGTGEQAGENGYEDYYYVSSLVGFANADDPNVLVYVGLNGTSYLASSSAAHVFSAIMSEALTDTGVPPTS